jgi:hypothetical protein
MSYFDVINDAVADMTEHGFDSQSRLDGWLDKIERAARAAMLSEAAVQNVMAATLGAVFSRMVTRHGVMKVHPGISKFTIDKLAPRLRNELDRRILASAQLIKLNRERSIAVTLQRFSGWSTSIPAGGSNAVDKPEVKAQLKKALKSLPYEDRRVAIDQSHKLSASINEVIALDAGAIAVEWHSHYRQPGYDYREDHKERDGKIYLIRDNWAQEKGLVKAGSNGYYDQITAVGEEIFCRCFARFVYSIRGVDPDMLTAKGRDAVQAPLKTA